MAVDTNNTRHSLTVECYLDENGCYIITHENEFNRVTKNSRYPAGIKDRMSVREAADILVDLGCDPERIMDKACNVFDDGLIYFDVVVIDR